MRSEADISSFNFPRSFYFQTDLVSRKHLDRIQELHSSMFRGKYGDLSTHKLSLVNVSRITLPHPISLTESATFFRRLREISPDVKPDFILSAPSVDGVPNSSPTGIPGGGSGSDPNRVDPAAIAHWRFNIGPLHNLVKASATTKLVDVVLIDTLPARNITDCDYMTSNPDLIELVNAMQNDKLRFRPSPDGIPLLETGSTKLPISSHGLFSANLIRQIAPNARITLLQGLNAFGHGYISGFMGLLNSELKWLIDSRKEEDGEAVILLNLSLVCHWPQQVADEFKISVEDLTDEFHEILGPLLIKLFVPKEVNIRIIAAAGNDGRKHTADLPASLDKIIATVALNALGQPANYSNDFDAADQYDLPGQMHTSGLAAFGGPLCSVFIDPTLTGPFGLQQENTNGYALWSGTSFATAIASGAMAFLCGAGFTPTHAHDLLKHLNPEVLRQHLP